MERRYQPGSRVRSASGKIYLVGQVGDMGGKQLLGLICHAVDEDGDTYSYYRWVGADQVELIA